MAVLYYRAIALVYFVIPLALSWVINYVDTMRTLAFIITVIALAIVLTACNRNITLAPEDLPVIDLVATHDFEIDIPVARLTFVPNSAAPWLGRVMLLSEDGKIYSTDIEGRDPKPVGRGKYIDIFGLARENAQGVFLAINKNNGIEAFIESDNDGNFSPMIYVGETISATMFCPDIASEKQATIEKQAVIVVTPEDKKIDLGFEISDSKVAQSIRNRIADTYGEAVCRGSASYPFLMKDGNILMLDPVNQGDGYLVNINDGLSIRGLNAANFIATTKASFGGVFSGGVVAMGDANDQRLVFISFDYIERKLEVAEETTGPQ